MFQLVVAIALSLFYIFFTWSQYRAHPTPRTLVACVSVTLLILMLAGTMMVIRLPLPGELQFLHHRYVIAADCVIMLALFFVYAAANGRTRQ